MAVALPECGLVVERYDTFTDQWDELPRIEMETWGRTLCCSVDKKIYVFTSKIEATSDFSATVVLTLDTHNMNEETSWE